MFRSIRWSLLAWHGLIQASVISGFGAVLYFQLRRSMLDGMNSDLKEQARSIVGVLKTKPGRRFEVVLTEEYRRRVQSLDTPTSYFVVWDPGGRIVDRSASGPHARPADLSPAWGDVTVPGQVPSTGKGAVAWTRPDGGELDERSPQAEGPNGGNHPGKSKKGELPPGLRRQGGLPPGLRRQGGLPPGLRKHGVSHPAQSARPRDTSDDGPVMKGEQPPANGMRDREADRSAGPGATSDGLGALGPTNPVDWQEVRVVGPQDAIVVVGRHTGEVSRRLAEFLKMGIAAGLGVLVLALTGDRFITWRALRPITRMSEDAAGITESDMSRRIDVARTKSELGELARILNATFDRLEAAFARQATFTADASHELRTPLSVVITHAELALRKDRGAPEYRQALETCLSAARRMKDLVDGLLTLARADASGIGHRKERFDLACLVKDVVAYLRPLTLAQRLRLDVTADDFEVDGDRDRLREVVTNLVSNAIRYNRDGGKIAVDARGEGDEAIITVADTGIGIPEADRPHVFDRFYRVDKARSRERGGVGLGLAITRMIVEAHGGSISLASVEGAGTTFTVRLPGPRGSACWPDLDARPRAKAPGRG